MGGKDSIHDELLRSGGGAICLAVLYWGRRGRSVTMGRAAQVPGVFTDGRPSWWQPSGLSRDGNPSFLSRRSPVPRSPMGGTPPILDCVRCLLVGSRGINRLSTPAIHGIIPR